MALSPMMKQYLEIKEQNPDSLLFFRLGDFYEIFFDDARLASKELDLVLTSRDCGLEERAPMCGVPFHSVDSYIAKLVANGHKVAICEQMSLPAKGIAPREIVRIITPGTVMESDMLSSDTNNYLLTVCLEDGRAGVCWADISTGEFNRTTIDSQLGLRLNDLLLRINPSEILCDPEAKEFSKQLSAVKYGGLREFREIEAGEFDLSKAREIVPRMCKDAENILKEDDVCVKACGALLRYVAGTQKRELDYIRPAEDEGATMLIDSSAARTLELTTSSNGKKQGSLYSAINRTQTGMGARLLGKRIAAPSADEKVINLRLDGVAELAENKILRGKVSDALSEISDIERMATRIAYGSITPKECVALACSLEALTALKAALSECRSDLLASLYGALDVMTDVSELIRSAVTDEPSAFVRDGGVIRKGYNEQLDEFRSVSGGSKSLLAKMEAEQKERTQIKNLRIGYNSVFGYYIEVPKAQIANVPYDYVRKQTVVNSERYITEELKILEDKILHAEEKALALEQQLYADLIKKLSDHCDRILGAAEITAEADVTCSNAEVAAKYKYVRPVVSADSHEIKIKEGRHPTVERIGGETFVPNDTYINDGDSRTMIITGPNMAGKSVYMRQVALIVILAQTGSFVPAESAELCITDRIFTRVGASDDLHTGRSTFMVEMSEVSNILANATDHSLILLDEVGRGTATYDGLSIAWAIIEYLSAKFTAKTLFSTHYHELTDIEGTIEGVKNYKMTVKELGGNIVFMRKLLRGSANRSFGIEVAGLSGLPKEVIDRAKEHLKQLEKLNITRQNNNPYQQLSIFNTNGSGEIIRILRDLDMDDVSPRGAYEILADLKEKATQS